jgi:hypothetical protein
MDIDKTQYILSEHQENDQLKAGAEYREANEA